jgi:NitT/TauT family transport system substrate-binding protein
MKRINLLTALFVFFLMVDARAAETNKISFCRPIGTPSALAFVAEEQGYFKAGGLEIDIQSVMTGKLCQDNLVAERVDLGLVADGPLSYLGFHEHNLRILAQIESNPELAVFARKDHGITTAADLKGKRIAYLPGTISYFYLVHLLDKLGLTLKDVLLTPLQPQAMSSALQGGLIDAFVIWEPWGSQALAALGDKGVRLRDRDLYYPRFLLIGTKKSIAKDPQAISKTIKALMQAEAYVKKNPDASVQFLAHRVQIDVPIIEHNWKDYDFTVKLDSGLIDLMSSDAKFILRDDPNFTGNPMPDFTKAIEPKFLRDIAPERVGKGM